MTDTRWPRRRAPLATAFGGLAAMLSMAAVAWACTAHQGNIWFCHDDGTPGCASGDDTQAFDISSEQVFWVRGTGLATEDTTQTINYVSTAAGVDAPCMFSPLVMETFEAGDDDTVDVTATTGNLPATKMKIPAVAGEWTACATYVSNQNGAENTISASNHHNFFTNS